MKDKHKIHTGEHLIFNAGIDKKPAEGLDIKKLKKLRSKQDKSYEYVTFKTLYLPEHLDNKRLRLIDAGFISSDTGENQFINIFTEQLISRKIQPVVWLGTKEALRFFLETLIPGVTLHKEQVANCFSDRSGNPIKISKPNRKKPIKHDTKTKLLDIIYKL